MCACDEKNHRFFQPTYTLRHCSNAARHLLNWPYVAVWAWESALRVLLAKTSPTNTSYELHFYDQHQGSILCLFAWIIWFDIFGYIYRWEKHLVAQIFVNHRFNFYMTQSTIVCSLSFMIISPIFRDSFRGDKSITI